jgi:archaetidylinositol phosphate synthase
MLVSYSRARAETAGVKMESVGIAERAERILILIAASVIAFFWFPSLNLGIAIIAVLSNLTVVQRVIHAYNVLKKNKALNER